MLKFKRGDVVEINAPFPTSGHIQGGRRPYIIVQNNVGNFYSPTTIVVPLTTKRRDKLLPTHARIECRPQFPSIALCEQVRVIDKSDEWRFVCHLPDNIMGDVDRALHYAFFYNPRGGEKR